MCVKPEALFSVSYLSTKQCNPSQRDFDCAIHILQYLYRTHDECMWLYGIGIGDPIIRVYADASHRLYEDLLCHGSSCVFIGSAGCTVFNTSNKISVHCK